MRRLITPYALITGASRGLGKAFAQELASRGRNVLLTALPGEDLQSFCHDLEKKYDIEAKFLECNLTDRAEISRLTAWVKDNYPIDLLINNAGKGGTSEFEKTSIDQIEDIILLNVRATAMLSHQLLPLLKKNKPAWILNVSSMASFSPIGYKTVYPASKVFVRHFSRGLYQELKGSGVFVSVVHPGPMRTNADCTSRIERQGVLAKAGLISPEQMARKSLTRLFKKDALILVGWMNRFQWLLMKTIPLRFRLPWITQIIKREIQCPPKHHHHESYISYRSQQLVGHPCDH
jgi:short-subunit dehydrogenase